MREPSETIAGWIEAQACHQSDALFVQSLEHPESLSYRALCVWSRRISAALAARGIGGSDRVLLLSGNSLAYLTLYLGVMAHGATVCTAQLEMNRPHLEHILRTLRPKLVLHAMQPDDPDLTLLRACPAEIKPIGAWAAEGLCTGFFAELELRQNAQPVQRAELERALSIVYTSGTEARPKGVVLSEPQLLANARAVAEALSMTRADRVLEFRDLSWLSAQVISCLAPLCAGATLLLAPKFSRERYFTWLRDARATIGVCNPTALAMLVNRPVEAHGRELPDLRFLTSSSAPLATEIWGRFEERYGIVIAQGYGASEVGWIALSNEHTRKLGTVGKPLAHQCLHIVDAHDHILPVGEVGEIALGEGGMDAPRYVGDDGAESIFVHPAGQGRVRVGDLGVLDEEGRLSILGRTKELIIRGGVNISPIEIDDVLLALDGVEDAAAFGVPDPIYGEQVACTVLTRPSATLSEEDVLTHCAARLPAFRVPTIVLLRTEPVPRNARGKVDRKRLSQEVCAPDVSKTQKVNAKQGKQE